MLQNLAFTLILAVISTLLTAAEPYKILSTNCDGLIQLPIGSYQGTCVGLLANSDVGFIKPRKAVQLTGTWQVLVTDMGGWSDKKGIVWLLDFSEGESFTKGFVATKLLTGLSLPHDIEVDDENRIYVGEAHQIIRFKLKQGRVSQLETVVGDLPFSKEYLHPLTNFAFLPNNDLLVNVGSRTDHCEGLMQGNRCSELEQNGLWLYSFDETANNWRQQGEHYASGLRNSMALAVHATGTVLQAENSSDLDDAQEPYEELNVIQEGGFYGWPYCLNEQFDQKYIAEGCEQSSYVKPISLIPPHTAPLDMTYVNSERLPMLNNTLLMSWHGYRVVGNRVVFYPIDQNGVPILGTNGHYYTDPIAPETTWQRHAFSPTGGFTQVAQPIELIYRWNAVPGIRPEGAPVGMTLLSDDSLLIVDDKNKQLLRVSQGQPYLDSNDISAPDITIEVDWTDQLASVYMQHCAACHPALQTHPELIMNSQIGWLQETDGVTLLEQKLFADVQAMPLTGTLTDTQKRELLAATLRSQRDGSHEN